MIRGMNMNMIVIEGQRYAYSVGHTVSTSRICQKSVKISHVHPENGYLHWAHAVFTIVKEIDGRFRICNNLDLIGHSASNQIKCRVFYQIKMIADPKPSINFLYDLWKPHALNANIHCGMKITIRMIPIKFGLAPAHTCSYRWTFLGGHF